MKRLPSRISKLEDKTGIGPEQKIITLFAATELGKPWGSNFTETELAQVKKKYEDLHKGQNVSLVFIVVKYTRSCSLGRRTLQVGRD